MVAHIFHHVPKCSVWPRSQGTWAGPRYPYDLGKLWRGLSRVSSIPSGSAVSPEHQAWEAFLYPAPRLQSRLVKVEVDTHETCWPSFPRIATQVSWMRPGLQFWGSFLLQTEAFGWWGSHGSLASPQGIQTKGYEGWSWNQLKGVSCPKV